MTAEEQQRTEIPLHLIHPLGFRIDDRHLRRAGLDYWQLVDVRQHESFDDFLRERGKKGRLLAFSRHSSTLYTETEVERGDYLLFGQETQGLPKSMRETYPCYALPIWGGVRSLNLSTAVGIVTYHYVHRMGRF